MLSKHLLVTLFFVAGLASHVAVASANNKLADCSSANDWAGRNICRNSILLEKARHIDDMINDLYASRPFERNNIKIEHARWRSSLSGCSTIGKKDGGSSVACLSDFLDSRMEDLNRMARKHHSYTENPQYKEPNKKATDITSIYDNNSSYKNEPVIMKEIEIYDTEATSPPIPTVINGRTKNEPSKNVHVTVNKPPKIAPVIFPDSGDCTKEFADEPFCVKRQIEQTEIDLQMITSSLSSRLNVINPVTSLGSSGAFMDDSNKNFRRYRETHCHFVEAIFKEEKTMTYDKCFLKLTNQRINEIKEIISLIDQR